MKDHVIKEFSEVYELANRLRTEVYEANKDIVSGDMMLFLMNHKKYQDTFRKLKANMADLDRAVSKLSDVITTRQFSYETDQK